MIHMLTYALTFILAMTFMQMNHPLAMGLILLMQTFTMCLLSGLLTKTFWFSYILFLIFLGGMLVLFIYVTSLASNEMFSLSINTMSYTMITLLMLLLIYSIMDKTSITPVLMNMEMLPTTNLTNYLQENTMNLNKLYNSPTNMVTLLLINYLLITLIAIVKITNIFHGPLRPMN